MYGEDCCRIQKVQNGYLLTMNDPAIIAANKKRDAMPYDSKASRPPYRDPEVKFTFKDTAAVTAFLTKNLEKMKPGEDYESSFDTAVAEANGGDD